MTTLLTKPRPATAPRLERWRRLVDQAILRTLPKATQQPPVVHEGMHYCVSTGGKRFRPLLCLGACEAVGGTVNRALPVAVALEFIHTYSLVHDDLPAMDNADERRGQPSCHRKFGEGNAILIGDALLTLAFELLARDGTPNALDIIRTVSQACGTAGLIGGQVLDLQALSRSRLMVEETLKDVARRKTGALIAASVAAGALAGDASGEEAKRLTRYGQHIGLAFQLIDDVHDREGLAQAMGTEAAQAEARQLIDRASEAVEPFGKRAEGLRQVAQWLAATS